MFWSKKDFKDISYWPQFVEDFQTNSILQLLVSLWSNVHRKGSHLRKKTEPQKLVPVKIYHEALWTLYMNLDELLKWSFKSHRFRQQDFNWLEEYSSWFQRVTHSTSSCFGVAVLRKKVQIQHFPVSLFVLPLLAFYKYLAWGIFSHITSIWPFWLKKIVTKGTNKKFFSACLFVL